MARLDIDALLVPHTDEYTNEYLPPCAERLAFVTGFTGSAGLAIVARRSAALFVDGRYILQAPQQVDTKVFEVLQIGKAKLGEWLGKTLKAGATIGFDPKLHSPATIGRAGGGARIQAHQAEAAWHAIRSTGCGASSGPRPPQGAVVLHPLKYAGKSAEDKLAEVQATLKKDGQDAVVLTFPPSICWLFNIRGSDVAHNPLVLAFAIVPASGKAELFIDPRKIGREAKAHLAPLAKLSEPSALERASHGPEEGRQDRAPEPRRRGLVPSQAQGRQGTHRARHRSLHPAQGAQERHRDQGRARRAQARRRGAGALPRLARPRGRAAAASTRSRPRSGWRRCAARRRR